MDLNDLKNTWKQISTGRELDETQLHQMLSKRTSSLIERIDRNIKIGFAVLFVLILVFAFDDFLVSPEWMNSMTKGVEIPSWLIFLSVFANMLILTTFVYFVVKYQRVKRSCDINCNLRETLKKIIDTLLLYQRLFYLALATFMVAVGLNFISGFYEGLNLENPEFSGQIAEIDTFKFVLTIALGLVILILLVGGFFLILRWGFRKLYGNYIQKLKATLSELDGVDEEND